MQAAKRSFLLLSPFLLNILHARVVLSFPPPKFCVRAVYYSHSCEQINLCFVLILIVNVMGYEMHNE
jgi:hypothetical protein